MKRPLRGITVGTLRDYLADLPADLPVLVDPDSDEIETVGAAFALYDRTGTEPVVSSVVLISSRDLNPEEHTEIVSAEEREAQAEVPLECPLPSDPQV